MKKLAALLLILCLLLAGCGHEAAPPTYTFEDLSIQIPEEYINLSDEDFAEAFTFVFGLDPIGLNGLREEKAAFAAYGLELDLETYGKLMAKANNVSAQPEQKDGIWTFSYESGALTYVVTMWETEEAFWIVQAYCPTADYSKVNKDMWEILSSVVV